MWRKAPMRELARFASMLAGSDMARRTYWRSLLGGRHWALLLLTHGREGEPPESQDGAPARLNPKWMEKTGRDLHGEDLLYLRILERLRAHRQSEPMTPETAASIAAHVAAELARDGLDLTSEPDPSTR